jgi:hypothetical protein
MTALLQTLVDQLDDNTINQLGAQLGLDQKTTQQAASVALPMLLRSLSSNASSADGAASLEKALRKKHDGTILNDVAGALSKPETVADGQAILGHVLGNRKDTVEKSLSKVSGIDANSSGQLLAALAPLVLGALGKSMNSQNLNADGLANLLKTERDQTESQLTGISKLLDLDGDGEVTDDVLSIGSSLLSSFFGNRK